MTESEINAGIAALNRAIAAGEQTVEYAGRRTTFFALDEMIKARNDLQRQLTASSNGDPASTARVRTTYAVMDRD